MRKKKDEKGLTPTRTFKNVLPPNCSTWHYLFHFYFQQSGGIYQEIPTKLKWEVIKANRELDIYQFDLDFIKARMIDEAFPTVYGLFQNIKGGQNYTRWEEYLRKFYNDYQSLIEGF